MSDTILLIEWIHSPETVLHAHVLQYCIVEDTRVRGMTAAVMTRRMLPFKCIRHKSNYVLYPLIEGDVVRHVAHLLRYGLLVGVPI